MSNREGYMSLIIQSAFRFLPFLLLLFLTGCVIHPTAGRKTLAPPVVSTAQQIEIGEKVFARAIQQMGGEVADPVLQSYVEGVGQRLARLSPRPDLPYRFVVVNDSAPNAFALPGGFIGISRGLLLHLENEAQLAAVLGNEIAHAAPQHQLRRLQRVSFHEAAPGAEEDAAYGPAARRTAELTKALLDRSYSREEQMEAARHAIDTMIAAGYDPAAAVQLQVIFQHIAAQDGSRHLGELFRSHPFWRDGGAAAEHYIRTSHPGVAGNSRLTLGREPFDAAVADLRNLRRAYELYDRAVRLERQNSTNEAIATFFQAATEAPSEPLILTALGMAYLRTGNYRAARPFLEQAVRLQGDYHLSRSGLGYVYLQQNEAARAVVQLRRAVELLPTLQGAFLLAEGYEKTGEGAKALVLYREVVQADPNGRLGRAAAQRVQILTEV